MPPSNDTYTGRTLVLFKPGRLEEGVLSVTQATNGRVLRASPSVDSIVSMEEADDAGVVVFDTLGIAVVGPGNAIPVDADNIEATEPERRVSVPETLITDPSAEAYLRGFRDACVDLHDRLTGDAPPVEEKKPRHDETQAANFADNYVATWGLQATRVMHSRYTGRGVRIAVLDTGIDRDHPDFAGRDLSHCQSFVAGEGVNDLHGHGTHCAGTALGGRQLAGGSRRYGCAPDAELWIGKVLGNNGSGTDSSILAGIDWAIKNKCQIVSMSLGSPVVPGDRPSPVYEAVAKRAMAAGTLLIAAAGNDSRNPATGRRSEPPSPVGRPANCESILAVGALDEQLAVAAFSNGGIAEEQLVDIAGPGVNVFSTAPRQPARASWLPLYHRLSGTSMATPHVAGIAALWLEAIGGKATPEQLWKMLTDNANAPPGAQRRDVGSGLVQAP